MLRPSLRAVSDGLPLLGRFQHLIEFCYGFMGVAILAGMLLWVSASHDRSRALEFQYIASRLHQSAITIQTPIRSLVANALPASETGKLQNLADRISLNAVRTADGQRALVVDFSIDDQGSRISTSPQLASDLLGAWLPTPDLPSLEFLLLDHRFRVVLAQKDDPTPAALTNRSTPFGQRLATIRRHPAKPF